MVIDMTIDEAIAHAKEVAEEKYNEGFLCHANPDDGKLDKCVKCAQGHEQLAEWLTQLKEYQQLEEQGRLVILPCKIGTKVYNTTWWRDVQEKVKVKGKTYYRTVHKHKITKSTFSYFDIEEFGKTVFLTKSEAETKLKELRCNND